jgi:hypothetical protein
LVVDNLAEGISEAELLQAYPQLQPEDIRAALVHGDRTAAADLLEQEHQRDARRAQQDQETERVDVGPEAGLLYQPAFQERVGLPLGDDRIGVA